MMSESLLALSSLTPLDLKQLSRQQKINILKDCRENGLRNSNAVVLLGTDVLAGGSNGLTNLEIYDLYEQLLIASLELGKISSAKNYLNLLENRFGKRSMRVGHLRGLCLEAENAFTEAKKLYEQQLKETPTDPFPVMRLSAIYKSEGRYADAIDMLQEKKVYIDEDDQEHTFFEVHRGDSFQVYQEISELYYLLGKIDRAIFFKEEALLFKNNSYAIHANLGELSFIKKDYKRSVIEFSQSLLFNDQENNSRSAYGLWMSANEIIKEHNSGVVREEEESLTQMKQLRSFAGETLRQMYAGSSMLSSLEAFLQRAA